MVALEGGLKFADLWISFQEVAAFYTAYGILTTAYKSEESWWGMYVSVCRSSPPIVLAPGDSVL